jgi:hypothetical protein
LIHWPTLLQPGETQIQNVIFLVITINKRFLLQTEAKLFPFWYRVNWSGRRAAGEYHGRLVSGDGASRWTPSKSWNIEDSEMDRQIVYPGSIPLDTDILSLERSTLVALGYLAQATLGSNVVADGLSCTPTVPASMEVTVGPGSITQYGVIDTLAFGSLPASALPLLRMGINEDSTSFTVLAPSVSGQAIDYLIEASLLESDATPVVLPYYNAANPGQPYSGPTNSGAAQNTQRLQRVQLQLKAGVPGPAGTQLAPVVDAGWVGLYVVTVTTGQAAISAANIAALPGAPFIPWKLPSLSPGTHQMASFTPADQGSWIVPAGVATVRLRIWGGGGAGGSGLGGAGGGGAGGGYCEGFFSVTPGQNYSVIVGNGGAGAGTSGGGSSFGSVASASGGQPGANGASSVGGAGAGSGGSGSGSGFLATGQGGGSAFLSGADWVSGGGGASYGGGGADGVVGPLSSNLNGAAATLPGGGGAGGIGNGLGGQGGPGLVLVEW